VRSGLDAATLRNIELSNGSRWHAVGLGNSAARDLSLACGGPVARRRHGRQVRIAPSTLSHHLDALRRSGLLASRRDGRFIYYAVDWGGVGDLLSFLTEDCCAGRPKRKTSGGSKK
jgi:DNA-binding transcriptional ArsR family regulator